MTLCDTVVVKVLREGTLVTPPIKTVKKDTNITVGVMVSLDPAVKCKAERCRLVQIEMPKIP